MEIDERVVSVSKEYLPSLASYTAHPKATLHFMDAFQWVKTQANASMDIVIVDLLLDQLVNRVVLGGLDQLVDQRISIQCQRGGRTNNNAGASLFNPIHC